MLLLWQRLADLSLRIGSFRAMAKEEDAIYAEKVERYGKILLRGQYDPSKEIYEKIYNQSSFVQLAIRQFTRTGRISDYVDYFDNLIENKLLAFPFHLKNTNSKKVTHHSLLYKLSFLARLIHSFFISRVRQF